jgi:hypothetical protein
MSWPYNFVDLTQDDIIKRRILLNRYGVYAQLSALVPVLAYQLYRLGVWVSSQRKRTQVGYTKVSSTPGSPFQKQIRLATSGGLAKRWRSTLWWLEGELYPGWGLRGHWIAGLAWASWLLFLSVHKTGDGEFRCNLLVNFHYHEASFSLELRLSSDTQDMSRCQRSILRLTLFYKDYMHVTKRFGHIAASQFPFHYMLSMKSIYSPLAFAFGTSHEHLNAYHRISGRIIYCLLVLHATLYLNFFAHLGVLQSRLTHLVPFLGALSITLLTLLATTSLESIRSWSYRVFFIIHLTIAVSLMPILFFHAPPLRFFTMEALALFVIDTIIRKLDTVTATSKITSVEHTNLVRLASPIPASKIGRFNVAPGQHVYLSIPPQSVGSKIPLLSIYQLLYNPFTVADVSPRGILLVLRTLNGPTTRALKQLTTLPAGNPGINIEGPYGVARRFPNFAAEFDRILLVAGGVGATFILPIYHRMTSGIGNEGSGTSRVELIWAMRSLAEARWVTNTEYGNVLEGDDRVKVYVTGVEPGSSEAAGAGPGLEDGSVEMEDLLQKEQPGKKVTGGHMRPNLRSIVDSTFRHGVEERVAVLVCGPAEMARELRQHVGRWVAQGRSVWWHDESFGW